MRFQPHEQVVIAAALRALASGDGKRFDDLLWLGLGDRAQDAYSHLEAKALIDNPTSISAIRLSPKGHAALAHLNASSRVA